MKLGTIPRRVELCARATSNLRAQVAAPARRTRFSRAKGRDGRPCRPFKTSNQTVESVGQWHDVMVVSGHSGDGIVLDGWTNYRRGKTCRSLRKRGRS
jgi:hypothetical protein